MFQRMKYGLSEKGCSQMIKYVVGDATEPQGSGPQIIAHIVNNRGGWGRGFVVALSQKYPEAEEVYRELAPEGLKLGDIQVVNAGNRYICNMIAQDGYGTADRPRAVNYAALSKCLLSLGEYFPNHSIHMPRIGAGLGGGDWDIIEQLIGDALGGHYVYIYDLPVKPSFEEPPVGRRVYRKEWSFEHTKDGWRGSGMSRMTWEELWARFGPVWRTEKPEYQKIQINPLSIRDRLGAS